MVALSGDTLVVTSHHEASAATGIDGDESDKFEIDDMRKGLAVLVWRKKGCALQDLATEESANVAVEAMKDLLLVEARTTAAARVPGAAPAQVRKRASEDRCRGAATR